MFEYVLLIMFWMKVGNSFEANLPKSREAIDDLKFGNLCIALFRFCKDYTKSF